MAKLLLSRWRDEQGLPPPCPEVKAEEWAAPRAGDTPLVALARQISSNAQCVERRAPRAPRAAPPPPGSDALRTAPRARALARFGHPDFGAAGRAFPLLANR